MALSQADAVSALDDLMAENTKTFEVPHYFFEAVIDNASMEKLQGPRATFVVTPTGPGNATSHKGGSETFNGGRRENSVKASAFLGQSSYTVDIPDKEIRRLGGKQDLVKLLKQYPENGDIDFKQKLVRQVFSGNEAEMDAHFTMNSQQSYDPEGLGARTGLFEAAAPTAQTGTVFGLAKNSVKRWHHQYERIGSFAVDGVSKLRRAHYAAQAALKDKRAKGIKFWAVDALTFYNYVDWMDDRVVVNDKPKTDSSIDDVAPGLSLMGTGSRIYLENGIDLDAFTGDMADGVAYGLDPGTWVFFTAEGEHAGEKLVEGWFGHRKPYWMPDQPVLRCVSMLTFNMYCFNIAKNALVTGGAR